MSYPPLGIVPPVLNDAPVSPVSPPRGPMGGGAFIVARRGTVYVTPGPYLPIAKRSKVTVRAERATDAESLIATDRALSENRLS